MEHRPIDRRTHPPDAVFSTWRAPDGWLYRRMDWPQPQHGIPRGSLIFAGGRGDFIEKYLDAFADWHARGWNVTAFDWRGQGGSSGSIVGGHLDSLDPLVADLAALIEDWQGRMPGPHAAIAHSMGGHILLRTLIERRPKLDAAVLVAPMLTINSAPVPVWAARAAASILSFFGAAKRPAWRPSVPPSPAGSPRQIYLTGCRDRYEDELWWWDREPGYNLGAPSWGWLRAAYRSSARLNPAALAKVGIPLLLLGTERDRLVSPAAIRRAASFIPRAELLMFKDAGHEILRERDGVRLASLSRIDSFLDAHAPR